MSIPTWQPATLYPPGSLVRRLTTPAAVQSAPDNANFDDGAVGWTLSDPILQITNSGSLPKFNGSYVLEMTAGFGTYSAINENLVPVTPGLSITAWCYVNTTGQTHLGRTDARCVIFWYDADENFIVETQSGPIRRTNNSWQLAQVTGVAPANAAFAAVGTYMFRDQDSWPLLVDAFGWDYTYAGPVATEGLVFRAVQTDAGISGNIEPTWPSTVGNQVVDNEVIWEAVLASIVIWEATAILRSGATEPDWPTEAGGAVVDNTISWQATSGLVEDERCPHTPVVVLAASKVFAADDDIMRFSATVNPVDWSTSDDAGYLPFGLQTYGSTPITAAGLYRSNLVIFNEQSFQMWQVDQDPSSMALLDAVPVGCPYPKTTQPFANDLVFLSRLGYRNITIAGASTNLQADGVGEPIDPLVVAKIRVGTYEPTSLYWPAGGQYWGIFGDEAFVLTINGVKAKSWSRYTFPDEITDWTIHGSDLLLRTASGYVWRVDTDAVHDDVRNVNTVTAAADGADTGYSFAGAFGTLLSTDMDVATQGRFASAYTTDNGSYVYDFTLELTALAADNEEPATVYVYDGATPTSWTLLAALDIADATRTVNGTTISYTWADVGFEFVAAQGYGVELTPTLGGYEEISGLVQWPHLDLGSFGVEKALIGFDLVCDAPEGVSVSVGYDQTNLNARTTPYAVSADTLPGKLIPLPVSAPSFDLQLTFEPGQAWEFFATNLYIQDRRPTS